MTARSLNITLACGHDGRLSQLARDNQTAWCYVCEQHVEVTVTGDTPAAAEQPDPGPAAQ
jgi:hypothetical protein